MENSSRDGNTRPPYLPLRNVYAGQEATVRTRHGTTDWFQIGKGVCQVYTLLPCLFNFYSEYIKWNARLDESQAGSKTDGKNINNLRYADDTTLMTESEEELKCLLKKVKQESEKAGLKLNIKKLRSWYPVPWLHGKQKGKEWKQWQILFSWAPKSLQMVTVAMKLKDACSLAMTKAMTNLDSVLKSRDITLPAMVHTVKAMVFPGVMYR